VPDAQIMIYGKNVDFYNVDRLYFLKVCLICGKDSNNTIQKSLLGNFDNNKQKHKNYYIDLPLCEECNGKLNIQINKERNKLTLLFITILVGAIFIFYFTHSIFMAIGITTIPFIISLFYYKSKVNKRINLNKFIQIKTNSLSDDIADDVLQLTFLNQNYANNLVKINLEQNKDLKLVKLFRTKF